MVTKLYAPIMSGGVAVALRPVLGADTTIPAPDTFVIGVTEPTSANTGPLAGTVFTTLTGDQTITTDGTVIENKIINGRVLVRAANVTIRNCIVRLPAGLATGFFYFTIDCNHVAARNVLIERCEVYSQGATLYTDGIGGHDFTARRNHVHHTTDHFGVYNNNDPYKAGPTGVIIEGNYTHDLIFQSPDPGQPDNRTHNDCCQIQGGTGTILRGNSLNALASNDLGSGGDQTVPAPNPYHPYTGSIISVTPNVSAVTGILIENNWLYGGYRGLGFVANKFGSQNIGTIQGNRFGRPRASYNIDGVVGTKDIIFLNGMTAAGMSGTSTQIADPNGNVYTDNGQPVVVQFRTTV